MVIMEGIIMSFWLMLVCVVGISNGVEGMVCLYEKDVQERTVELGLTTKERIKRNHSISALFLFIPTLFGVPAVILWMGWFLYEIYQIQGGDFNNGFFWGGCVGGIIGAICGIKMHFKTQHQYQDIIDQIEDLTNDK